MKGNKKTIRLTESELRKIVKESVNNVLNEEMSQDYDKALKQVLAKAFSNLDDDEKIFLSDLLNHQTWDVVYAALAILKPSRLYEGKHTTQS